MSKTELTITISPAPGTRNDHRGRHWGKYVREKKRVGKEVAVQVYQAGRPQFERFRVSLRRIDWWNCVDPPGVWESVKPVLDALKDEGVIPEDSKKYLTLGDVEQKAQRKRPGWSELVVRLEEINV